ncbi:hypothetical protein FN846DRAFT_896109 [Sphaerosporella brunnea]|uniref:Uncharacterized protein n=1 Tax=Sphaerosporella brunnea TaxID=1250544 RepID=A0A5J5EEA5_9PEZI|nr:hypothetical protein FN846DRAFT_896109 [Sphaerosporella brunnea]
MYFIGLMDSPAGMPALENPRRAKRLAPARRCDGLVRAGDHHPAPPNSSSSSLLIPDLPNSSSSSLAIHLILSHSALPNSSLFLSHPALPNSSSSFLVIPALPNSSSSSLVMQLLLLVQLLKRRCQVEFHTVLPAVATSAALSAAAARLWVIGLRQHAGTQGTVPDTLPIHRQDNIPDGLVRSILQSLFLSAAFQATAEGMGSRGNRQPQAHRQGVVRRIAAPWLPLQDLADYTTCHANQLERWGATAATLIPGADFAQYPSPAELAAAIRDSIISGSGRTFHVGDLVDGIANMSVPFDVAVPSLAAAIKRALGWFTGNTVSIANIIPAATIAVGSWTSCWKTLVVLLDQQLVFPTSWMRLPGSITPFARLPENPHRISAFASPSLMRLRKSSTTPRPWMTERPPPDSLSGNSRSPRGSPRPSPSAWWPPNAVLPPSPQQTLPPIVPQVLALPPPILPVLPLPVTRVQYPSGTMMPPLPLLSFVALFPARLVKEVSPSRPRKWSRMRPRMVAAVLLVFASAVVAAGLLTVREIPLRKCPCWLQGEEKSSPITCSLSFNGEAEIADAFESTGSLETVDEELSEVSVSLLKHTARLNGKLPLVPLSPSVPLNGVNGDTGKTVSHTNFCLAAVDYLRNSGESLENLPAGSAAFSAGGVIAAIEASVYRRQAATEKAATRVAVDATVSAHLEDLAAVRTMVASSEDPGVRGLAGNADNWLETIPAVFQRFAHTVFSDEAASRRIAPTTTVSLLSGWRETLNFKDL